MTTGDNGEPPRRELFWLAGLGQAEAVGLADVERGIGEIEVSDAGVQLDPAYCKPVGAFLVRDSVEVRCYRVGTGAAVNSDFTLSVLGKRDDRAFAFANLPTFTNYAPASAARGTRLARCGSTAMVWAGTGWSSPASGLGCRRWGRRRLGRRGVRTALPLGENGVISG